MDQPVEPPPAIIQTVESLIAESETNEFGLFTVRHADASFSLSVHGANLLSYIPSGEVGEVIWTGGYEPRQGKDCWGGVPLVWPWFMMGTGDTPKGPFHGPARFATWNILDLTRSENATELRLGLPEPLQTNSGDIIPLDAELLIRLNKTLQIDLITRNPSDRPYPLEHCFHAYFKVGDVTRIQILGLDGTEVQDNRTSGQKRSIQSGAVMLNGPAARIYRPFPPEVHIDDPVLNRTITLSSPEATQLVLWNAGPRREENGRPTGEDEWSTQLALEPLRGLEAKQMLQPGGEARISLTIESRRKGTASESEK